MEHDVQQPESPADQQCRVTNCIYVLCAAGSLFTFGMVMYSFGFSNLVPTSPISVVGCSPYLGLAALARYIAPEKIPAVIALVGTVLTISLTAFSFYTQFFVWPNLESGRTFEGGFTIICYSRSPLWVTIPILQWFVVGFTSFAAMVFTTPPPTNKPEILPG